MDITFDSLSIRITKSANGSGCELFVHIQFQNEEGEPCSFETGETSTEGSETELFSSFETRASSEEND